MSLDLAARVSRGQSMPDGSPGLGPADVILLSAEDGLADTVRPRGWMRRVRTAPGCRSSPSPSRAATTCRASPMTSARCARRLPASNGALVVVDPLMAFLGGDVNSHRDQDVRRALAPLARVAEETGCAVLVLRPQQQGPAVERALSRRRLHRDHRRRPLRPRGGPGPRGRDPDHPRRRQGEPRAEAAEPRLPHRGRPQRRGAGGLAGSHRPHREGPPQRAPEPGGSADQTDQACDVLRELLADGKVDAKQARRQVMDGAGVSSRTVDIAKARLGVIAEREGYGPGGRWVWRLPSNAGRTHRAQPYRGLRSMWVPCALWVMRTARSGPSPRTRGVPSVTAATVAEAIITRCPADRLGIRHGDRESD